MFIDALTPHEPVPTTKPQTEHGVHPHLGTSSATNDLHARVHGDGTHCPICMAQINRPAGAFPNPALAADYSAVQNATAGSTLVPPDAGVLNTWD
jgi:hypothetical protein